MGGDWVAFDVSEDEVVARIAEQCSHFSCEVRVIDCQASVARSAGTDRTASILCLQQSLVFSRLESVDTLNVPFMIAVGPGLGFGPGLSLRL